MSEKVISDTIDISDMVLLCLKEIFRNTKHKIVFNKEIKEDCNLKPVLMHYGYEGFQNLDELNADLFTHILGNVEASLRSSVKSNCHKGGFSIIIKQCDLVTSVNCDYVSLQAIMYLEKVND